MLEKFLITTQSLKSLWVNFHLCVTLFLIDLEKIQKNLNDGQYHTVDQFKADLMKIFNNARSYNTAETIYYKYADQLQNLVKPMLDRIKDNSTIERDLKLLN